MRIAYRINQFWSALRSVPYPEELERVRKFLSPAFWSLFLQMQPAEQNHSIRVFNYLGQLDEPSPELLTASLLHDVGKIDYPLSPLERGLIVIAQVLFPNWAESWCGFSPDGWKRPFAVAACHPDWGAQIVKAAGASPMVENLIRRHQEKISTLTTGEDQLLFLLQKADGEN